MLRKWGAEALILAQSVLMTGASRGIGQGAVRGLVTRPPHTHRVMLRCAVPRDLVKRLRARRVDAGHPCRPCRRWTA